MPDFMCATVIDPVAGKRSICQLWNPPGSGVLLVVDGYRLAHSSDVPSGFDLRPHNMPIGAKISNPQNKYVGETPSVAELRGGTVAPSAIPGTVGYENWINKKFDDKPYPLKKPITLPQGQGVHVTSAHDGLYLIASFELSETPDPAGPVYSDANGMILGGCGTLDTSLNNGAAAFDASETTYANDNENTWFNIGKMWPAALSVDRFILKSPPGRSFSGYLPPRTLAWTLEAYYDGDWHNVATGTHVETSHTAQQTIDVTLPAPSTAMGHRVFIQDTAAAAHRVGYAAFQKAP